jgi:aspartate carbamoyltransferase catalytic subunit
MSLQGKSFISVEPISNANIESIFARAQLFKEEFARSRNIEHIVHGRGRENKVIAMVFSEPSTRTRMSFQMAAHRLGIRPISLDNMAMSSISKGETFADTLRNISAMQPDMMVVRYGGDPDADMVIQDLPFPVINGGIGAMEHPTQALLDAFTIREFRGKVEGEKVLIVGDVLHSRVANSNLVLLRKLGAEIGYCAPKEYTPKADRWKEVRHFADLKEGMGWASVVMGLRIQKERHTPGQGIGLTIAEYREKYRVGGDHLKSFKSDGILLHPGPVIRGVEFSDFVLKDPRCKVLDQVTNGVFIRAALLSMIMGFEVHK